MTVGCRNDLQPVENGRDSTGMVVFTTRGHVALIADSDVSAAVADALGAVAGLATLSIAAPGVSVLSLAQAAGACDLSCREDVPVSVDGWLGAFALDFADGSRTVADVVIDLAGMPPSDRSVPPLGYFAPRDREHVAEALAQAAELVGRFSKPKYFHYDPEICTHQSFGQTGCTRCLAVCAADAIRSEGGRIAVEPQLCQGCAACTLACPTGALS